MSYNQSAGKKRKGLRMRAWKWYRERPGVGATTKCHWCGELLLKSKFTVDHIVPSSEGGTDEKENVVPACRPCNNLRNELSGSGGSGKRKMTDVERAEDVKLKRLLHEAGDNIDVLLSRLQIKVLQDDRTCNS